MSTSTRTVTVTIVSACAVAVRRAWVPDSVLRSQSQKPVSAVSTETAAAHVEIVLRSGIVVRVGASFDESTLRRVIAILEGSH